MGGLLVPQPASRQLAVVPPVSAVPALLEVLRHSLHHEVARVDCAGTSGPDPGLAAVAHDRVVGAVTAKM